MITVEQAEELRRLMNSVIAELREYNKGGTTQYRTLIASAARLSYYIDDITEAPEDA